MTEVKVKNCDSIRLVAIRHVGPYMEIGKEFQRIMAYAFARGLFGPGTMVVGVYHDHPSSVPASELRSDAGVSLQGPHTPEEDTHVLELEGGTYAVAIHEGHYSTLANTYCAIAQWMESQGKQGAPRPCYEIYLNSPMDTKPEDLRTEVRIPVA